MNNESNSTAVMNGNLNNVGGSMDDRQASTWKQQAEMLGKLGREKRTTKTKVTNI